MLDAAHKYVSKLPHGTVVISGGALGIDTAVAEAAVNCGLNLELVVPFDKLWNDDILEWAEEYETIKVPGEYRERNIRMVNRCDFLVAFLLKGPNEFYRSGEWMTVNIAKKRNVEVEYVRGDW